VVKHVEIKLVDDDLATEHAPQLQGLRVITSPHATQHPDDFFFRQQCSRPAMKSQDIQ
jgi:hypothetical protein